MKKQIQELVKKRTCLQWKRDRIAPLTVYPDIQWPKALGGGYVIGPKEKEDASFKTTSFKNQCVIELYKCKQTFHFRMDFLTNI